MKLCSITFQAVLLGSLLGLAGCHVEFDGPQPGDVGNGTDDPTSDQPPLTNGQFSVKRGLAYGEHSVQDLAVLSQGMQWWYNWGPRPEAAVLSSYQDMGVEFVPMAWDENFDETQLRQYLDAHPDVRFLLGFNEPNFRDQANLTPAQVAQHWPRLETIAHDYDLKIVGPAVNFSPGGVDIPGVEDDSSPFLYLDAFFEACSDCQVDYLAVHSYMKYPSAVKWFVGQFTERYGKPVWLTEWASWDEGGPATVNEQMNYLANTARWLENNPEVYRYAWFIGRTDEGKDQHPYLDILDADGELTPLGGLYTHIPASDYRFAVNQRLQAEGGHRGEGYAHQPTSDNQGYVDIVWTDSSGFIDFDLRSEQEATVRVTVRAANAGAERILTLLIDHQPVTTLAIANTGGLNQWQTFTGQMVMPEGEPTLTIKTSEAGYAINWVQLTEL